MGNITPGPEKDTETVLREIIRRLTNLEQANPLQGGMVISAGGLTAVDPTSGHTTVAIGLGGFSDGSGRKQMRTEFRRADGTIAFVIADLGTAPGHPFAQALQMFDHSGNIWAADDIGGGVGIAEPQIPIASFSDIAASSLPITTSASYADLQWGVARRQHPRMIASLLVYSSSAGTTGNVQIVDGSGNVIGSPIAVTSLEFGLVTLGPVAWPSSTWAWNEGLTTLKLQAERTAGTGNIGARVLGMWGQGS